MKYFILLLLSVSVSSQGFAQTESALAAGQAKQDFTQDLNNAKRIDLSTLPAMERINAKKYLRYAYASQQKLEVVNDYANKNLVYYFETNAPIEVAIAGGALLGFVGIKIAEAVKPLFGSDKLQVYFVFATLTAALIGLGELKTEMNPSYFTYLNKIKSNPDLLQKEHDEELDNYRWAIKGFFDVLQRNNVSVN